MVRARRPRRARFQTGQRPARTRLGIGDDRVPLVRLRRLPLRVLRRLRRERSRSQSCRSHCAGDEVPLPDPLCHPGGVGQAPTDNGSAGTCRSALRIGSDPVASAQEQEFASSRRRRFERGVGPKTGPTLASPAVERKPMPRPRNDRCSGCGKSVSAGGKCVDCRRTKRQLHYQKHHPRSRRHRTFAEKAAEQQSGTRRCTGCRSWKPLGAFYARDGGYLRSACSDCMRERARGYAAMIRQRRRDGDEHLRTLRREQKRRARARKRT